MNPLSFAAVSQYGGGICFPFNRNDGSGVNAGANQAVDEPTNPGT